MMLPTGLWTAILAGASAVIALGIDWQGSSKCNGQSAWQLTAILNTLQNNDAFAHKCLKLACVNGCLCAFTQNLPSGTQLTANQIKSLAHAIINHGRSTCRSAPLWSHNVAQGQLTFNYVSSICATSHQ
ncbi:killer toxin [Lasiosphaeria miniovina]|uniref:Killer toxin n=1 Tax=Lasiosphaeria miniovina TaxID=1954250 RepID=A0AA40ALU0_9PEZI|nr:killer toxin [Lasiosphaeria miniovina]KAK0718184.1 killer toxin [Lasiosphaeria miniovina]